jgi:beta-1,2-mannobiose phosphorylase / 1,2-beta-oligomannan phosphorylase
MKIRGEKVLITPEDIKPSSNKFEVLGVLNPGVVRINNKKIVMYVRVIEKLKKHEDKNYFYSPRFAGKKDFRIVIDKFKKNTVKHSSDVGFDFIDGTKRLTYLSHLRRVLLDETGFKILKIEQKPSFYGSKTDSELGVEDPRITKIEDMYYMTYVGLGRNENISTNLAFSYDCVEWIKKGVIFGEQDKDVILFPEKINGKFAAFDRPEGTFAFTPPHMWVAYSKDLQYWGKLKPLVFTKHFNFSRSGAGPPPIKTNQGWLVIFHGVTKSIPGGLVNSIKKFFKIHIEEKETYAVWAALFELTNPRKLIAKSSKPILVPKKAENLSFEDKMVIFPTGVVHDLDKKHILLYSGLGDISIGVQKIAMDDLMKALEKV